jgi:predicted NBD/HSP70 family sugar kinase
VNPSGSHIVFDVGGTLLRAALYDGGRGCLVEVARTPAPSFARHPDASFASLRAKLVEEMSALRARLDPAGTIASAAIAFPGPLDRGQRILAGPTLWGSVGEYPYDLAQDLRRAWPGAEIQVMNDVTAAGFRYLRSADEDFCVVAVSTGIGNKVFVRGRPLLGASGRGGEIGHLRVDPAPNAALCDCGGRGHVGAIASGRATLARARRRAVSEDAFGRSSLAASRDAATTLSTEALASAYASGDPWAESVVGEGAGALGLAFAAIHLAIGVDRFVLIGGFALGLGPRFCDDVRKAVDARCWQGAPGPVTVVLGENDGHCALVGGGRAQELGLCP